MPSSGKPHALYLPPAAHSAAAAQTHRVLACVESAAPLWRRQGGNVEVFVLRPKDAANGRVAAAFRRRGVGGLPALLAGGRAYVGVGQIESYCRPPVPAGPGPLPGGGRRRGGGGLGSGGLRLGSTEGFGGGDDEGFGGGFGGGDDEGFGGGFGGFGGDDGGFGGGGDEGGFGGDALEAYMEREKGSAVSGRGGGIDLDALGYRGGD